MNALRPTPLICAVAMVMACQQSPGESTTRAPQVIVPAASSSHSPGIAHGTFAYVDSTGTELLALDSLADPSTIVGALCSGAVARPVRFDRKQVRQPHDNARQVSSNFVNEAGDVFALIQERAPSDKTCYLTSDSVLFAAARAATVREASTCAPAQVARVTVIKAREVIRCSLIARTSNALEVLAIQFVNVDSSALASLVVVVADTSFLFRDFPAVYRNGGESTWRVDDEGVFSPKDFDVLFVDTLPYGVVMAFTWAGPEGESDELLLADSTRQFRTLHTSYRYWSPS